LPATFPTKLLGAWLPRKKIGNRRRPAPRQRQRKRMCIRTWQPAARNGHSDFGVDAIVFLAGFRPSLPTRCSVGFKMEIRRSFPKSVATGVATNSTLCRQLGRPYRTVAVLVNEPCSTDTICLACFIGPSWSGFRLMTQSVLRAETNGTLSSMRDGRPA
jgi:hypothetical protein